MNSITSSTSPMQNLVDGLNSGRIKQVNLTGSRFSKDDLERLASGLRRTSALRALVLSDCDLWDPDLEPILRALQRNNSLEMLDLSHNKLSSASTWRIREALRYSKLKSLVLSDNQFDNTGAEHLQDLLQNNPSIEFLAIECCGFAPEASRALLALAHENHNRGPIVQVQAATEALTQALHDNSRLAAQIKELRAQLHGKSVANERTSPWPHTKGRGQRRRERRARRRQTKRWRKISADSPQDEDVVEPLMSGDAVVLQPRPHHPARPEELETSSVVAHAEESYCGTTPSSDDEWEAVDDAEFSWLRA